MDLDQRRPPVLVGLDDGHRLEYIGLVAGRKDSGGNLLEDEASKAG